MLKEKKVDPEVILYLEDIPTKEELKKILDQLEMKPYDLIRKGEKIFKEEYKGKSLSDEQWIEVMIRHPKLIERPIVIHKGKAKIGRPPESVLDIL